MGSSAPGDSQSEWTGGNVRGCQCWAFKISEVEYDWGQMRGRSYSTSEILKAQHRHPLTLPPVHSLRLSPGALLPIYFRSKVVGFRARDFAFQRVPFSSLTVEMRGLMDWWLVG